MSSLSTRVVRRIEAQFGRPSGLLGPLVGWIMAARSSNRARNAWAVSLLEIEPRDRVLEIGFGPGVAIREIARLAVDGHVCGIDHSARMRRQARRRNGAAIRAGRVELRLGSVESLPAFAAPFDKVLAVNTLLFWEEPAVVLERIRGLMIPGGKIAIAHQPRGPGASDAVALERAGEVAEMLARAGFAGVRLHTLRLVPAVVCVLGVNPEQGGS